MSNFNLHPQLAKDCIEVCELALCKVLLMNDQNYPWLILVPMKKDITEVYQLSAEDQQAMWQEVSETGEKLMAWCEADKLNVAALGNMVPQLHIHVIARKTSDKAWPNPIWGHSPTEPYSAAHQTEWLGQLRALINHTK